MREWRTPELLELRAQWTNAQLFTAGTDAHGESVILNGEEVGIGSACCC